MQRIYLLGRTAIETPTRLVDSAAFPGRQGRLLFSVLAWERIRISREALAEILWPPGPPETWEGALSALLSKLRTLLRRAGFDSQDVLVGSEGACELRLPEGIWLDIREGINSLDRAEGSLRLGDLEGAWSEATVASAILRRPFLVGEYNPWVESRRSELVELRWRGLDCLCQVWIARGDLALAIQAARQLIQLAPLRESSHARLMECHLAAGNRAEALRAFENVRALLQEELGVTPTERIETLYLKALG